MNTYDIGAVVRSSVAFTDLAGTAVDPGGVTFKMKSPLGTITTYVFPADTQVVKDSTGKYHVDVEPDRQGIWSVRWAGTGANKSASESGFQVGESQFD
jgi:hypothetical protein